MGDQEHQWYSIKEFAEYLRLHPSTVIRLIKQGQIEAMKIGRAWRIPRRAFDLAQYSTLKTAKAALDAKLAAKMMTVTVEYEKRPKPPIVRVTVSKPKK